MCLLKMLGSNTVAPSVIQTYAKPLEANASSLVGDHLHRYCQEFEGCSQTSSKRISNAMKRNGKPRWGPDGQEPWSKAPRQDPTILDVFVMICRALFVSCNCCTKRIQTYWPQSKNYKKHTTNVIQTYTKRCSNVYIAVSKHAEGLHQAYANI